MTDCTKTKCCNTCKNSRIKHDSTNRDCVVDFDPYKGYLGGHRPDYVCNKFEPVDWFCADGEPKEDKHD